MPAASRQVKAPCQPKRLRCECCDLHIGLHSGAELVRAYLKENMNHHHCHQPPPPPRLLSFSFYFTGLFFSRLFSFRFLHNRRREKHSLLCEPFMRFIWCQVHHAFATCLLAQFLHTRRRDVVRIRRRQHTPSVFWSILT